jgi:hypothetical protein
MEYTQASKVPETPSKRALANTKAQTVNKVLHLKLEGRSAAEFFGSDRNLCKRAK